MAGPKAELVLNLKQFLNFTYSKMGLEKNPKWGQPKLFLNVCFDTIVSSRGPG